MKNGDVSSFFVCLPGRVVPKSGSLVPDSFQNLPDSNSWLQLFRQPMGNIMKYHP
jgi:hypothetical protein